MLAHELLGALAADRERTFRERRHARALARRGRAPSRLRDRLLAFLRPRPGLPPARSARVVARDLGGVAPGVSGRAGDTHGQGAC